MNQLTAKGVPPLFEGTQSALFATYLATLNCLHHGQPPLTLAQVPQFGR
jgi:hypothetical protein